MATASPEGLASRLASFVRSDHRYVLLGTSAVALMGLALANQPHSAMSVMGGSYALECALYYVLIAWLVVSAVALVTKLVTWRRYAEVSPFARPAARRVERYGSYVVWVTTLAFVVDRVVLGFAALVAGAVSQTTNPTDFWSSSVYMLYNTSDVFLSGIKNTVLLATFGTIIAFVLALLLCFLRIQEIDRSDNDFVRFLKTVGSGFAKAYSAVVRGTPMMIQALIIYFAGFALFRRSGMSVSETNAFWSTFIAGLVTISLNSTAYMMEVLRAGIGAVDDGQAEAARSLGMSQWQAMIKVVFPQGVKNAIPALSNELVINIKDSSVLSVIGVVDLMFATTTIAGRYYKQMEIYVVAAAAYFVLTLVASRLLNMLSRHLDGAAPGPVLSTSDVPVPAEKN